MKFDDRISIIEALSIVDKVISFDDKDDSACGAIYKTMATLDVVKLFLLMAAIGSILQQPNTKYIMT